MYLSCFLLPFTRLLSLPSTNTLVFYLVLLKMSFCLLTMQNYNVFFIDGIKNTSKMKKSAFIVDTNQFTVPEHDTNCVR